MNREHNGGSDASLDVEVPEYRISSLPYQLKLILSREFYEFYVTERSPSIISFYGRFRNDITRKTFLLFECLSIMVSICVESIPRLVRSMSFTVPPPSDLGRFVVLEKLKIPTDARTLSVSSETSLSSLSSTLSAVPGAMPPLPFPSITHLSLSHCPPNFYSTPERSLPQVTHSTLFDLPSLLSLSLTHFDSSPSLRLNCPSLRTIHFSLGRLRTPDLLYLSFLPSLHSVTLFLSFLDAEYSNLFESDSLRSIKILHCVMDVGVLQQTRLGERLEEVEVRGVEEIPDLFAEKLRLRGLWEEKNQEQMGSDEDVVVVS